MSNTDPGRPEPGPDASVEDIQADIEATRTELGQTVEALTAKLDVKQQASRRSTTPRNSSPTRRTPCGPRVLRSALRSSTSPPMTKVPCVPWYPRRRSLSSPSSWASSYGGGVADESSARSTWREASWP